MVVSQLRLQKRTTIKYTERGSRAVSRRVGIVIARPLVHSTRHIEVIFKVSLVSSSSNWCGVLRSKLLLERKETCVYLFCLMFHENFNSLPSRRKRRKEDRCTALFGPPQVDGYVQESDKQLETSKRFYPAGDDSWEAGKSRIRYIVGPKSSRKGVFPRSSSMIFV